MFFQLGLIFLFDSASFNMYSLPLQELIKFISFIVKLVGQGGIDFFSVI